MSHAYFSNGVRSSLQSIFATHPPLDERIKRIDPQWDGKFPPVTHEVSEDENLSAQTKQAATDRSMQKAAAGIIIANQVLNNVGQTSPEHLDYAVALVNDIPSAIHDAAHEPYAARAVIYCLVFNTQPDVKAIQLEHLKLHGDTGIFDLVNKLQPSIDALNIRFRLPLIVMTLPSLRQLSVDQYQNFKQNLLFLMQADKRIDLFEWSLQKILFHHLDPGFDHPGKKIAKFGALQEVKHHIDVLMSMLVYACVQDKTLVDGAWASAEKELGLDDLALIPRNQITIDSLNYAVDHLALLKPLLKPRLLKACLAVITQDKNYSATEMELMRAIADVLDCPLPPFLG